MCIVARGARSLDSIAFARKVLVVIGVGFLVMPVSGAEERSAGGVAALDDGQVLDSPPISERLRFRRGPMCTCSTGLGESDIKAADTQRQEIESGDAVDARP